MFYKDDRLAVFVDGGNLHNMAQALGFSIDFKKLRAQFTQRGKLVRTAYYTCTRDYLEHDSIRRLLDFLDFNGWDVQSKSLKEYASDDGGTRVKGSMRVELAVDALRLAPRLDHFVLFSGDGEYTALVHALRDYTRVSVCAAREGLKVPMVADDLRRAADNFIDLETLRDLIAKDVDAGGSQIIRPAAERAAA